jgi:ubiquinone/menaquinone biosynthesis C-methylase UbiE
LDEFLGMLPPQDFSNILEIGIGTGAVAQVVSERIGPLTGIDISAEMIAKINHNDIETQIADAHALPFEKESFDLIYMRNVIHYLDDPRLAFSEINRCLKPDGYFLFSQVVPPDDSISEEYDWLIGRNIHYPTNEEILNYFQNLNVKKQKKYVLENQSVLNWLRNTCNDEAVKEEIIQRHHDTSDQYKELAKFRTKGDDILVNINHLLILGKK